MRIAINIFALIILCIGVIIIFFKRDILKMSTSKLITNTSGFVVSLVALILIYIFNR